MKDKNKSYEIIIQGAIASLKSHKLLACEPHSQLFHYTDLDGANGIITSKSLWLTKIQYLRDTTELKLGIGLFRDAIKTVIDEIDDSEKKEYLNLISKQLISFTETNICIVSFCRNGDLLSQWRSYGNSGNGVALGFSGKALKELEDTKIMNLWKCIYNQRDQHKLTSDLVKSSLKSYDSLKKELKTLDNVWEDVKNDLSRVFTEIFIRVSPIIKNVHFQEEEEWRLVTIPIPRTDKNCHARVTNQRAIQYYKLGFPILENGECEFIKSLITGPTNDASRIGNAFVVLLREYGYKCEFQGTSQIPPL